MIPLEYRLREQVRLEPARSGTWHVVCAEPLAVMTVNAAAARLLDATRRGRSVSQLAAGLNLPDERILALCEYFRARGLLKVGRADVPMDLAPSVSVIVPTLDRADELDECLRALGSVEYPVGPMEVIVVDDGSSKRAAISRVAAQHGARLLVNENNRGPSYSRNRAAAEARGEILAFVDSDCVPGPGWLRELTPYFTWERVGAVGGRTRGYYTESFLDRYEEVSSPLDMGRHLMLKAEGNDTFYVPTCNLLIRRCLYLELGGLREDLQVGEDVDLCWRLRASGAYLVYAPEGVVRHKHRDRLGPMLRRRAQYGTSEAVLHALHGDKRKRFPLAPVPLATVALVSAALIRRDVRLAPLCLVPFLVDSTRRRGRLRERGIHIPRWRVWNAVLRVHLSTLYFVYFHLTRYYLAPLAVTGAVVPGLRIFGVSVALYSSAVDYATREPRLPFPIFAACYLAEHAAYQTGVAVGCVRVGSIRSYAPVFERRSPLELPEPG